MRKTKLKRLFTARGMLAIIFTLVSTLVLAQTKNVTGTVVDENGEGVIGASVSVRGTTTGTVTDIDGRFSINAGAQDVLVVKFIGYIEQTITVGNQSNFAIVLKDDTQLLDEVVVVGYGTQRKSDVTGAMARVGEKELKAMPVANAIQAMQGKAAGVDITTNQRPGQVGTIRIRGERSLTASNDPLYVVDGMLLNISGIDNINPSDIESIDILKDASATAVYGSRGANGVVLVTTKKGKAGALSVNYSGTVTFEKLYNVSDNMSAGEWIDYARLARINSNDYGSDTPSYAADYAKWGSVSASWANIAAGWTNNNTVWDPDKAISYDWEKHGKQTGVSTEHTISVSGGSEKSQGYGSFGYLKQEGTQPGQKYERFTGKVSFDASPTKWFKMGTSINGSWGDQDYGYSFTKSVTGAGDYYGALRGMLAWSVPYDENGELIRNPAAGHVNIINPIEEINYTQNNRQTFLVNASFYGQLDLGEIFKPLQGLKYRIQFGPEFRYYRLGVANDADGINGDGNNIAQYQTNQRRSWTLDNLIYYDRNFGADHKMGLTLLQSAWASHEESGDMRSNTLASADELWYNISSGGSLNAFGTGLTEKQMASYMIRANYSFRDKYLLTASIRWDGASQLADGNKWASFPSLAVGWRLDQEKFMQDQSFINAFKLRFGVGTSGNDAVRAYQTKGGITQLYYNWSTTASSPGYVASDLSAKTPVGMANPNMTWEKTTQYNVGLDYGFLNSRINGSIDVYKSKTKDLLLEMSIPSLTGYLTTIANVGKTEGWGIDLQVNSVNVQTKDFSWLTNLTWSLNRNKIVELANGSDRVGTKWWVGEEMSIYYDYVYDGVWKTSEAEEAAKYGRKPGQIRVKDLNDDGKIDDNNDKTIITPQSPRWTGGMTNTFNYKNLELSFFIYSRWGHHISTGGLNLGGEFQMRSGIDYWVAGVNEDAKYYSPGSNGVNADTYASSQGYEDASFIKMRNINLGYNFNQKQIRRLGINNLKVYAQLLNPFTIYSKCDYLDTDLSDYSNNATSTGASVTTKALVFGLNISF